MDIALLALAVVSGALTVVFVFAGLPRILRTPRGGMRSLVAAVACSLITGVLMIYEFVVSAQQLLGH